MEPKIIRQDESEEFPTAERCHILEIINQPENRSYSLARARVEPGVTTAWHSLKDTTELYYILSGNGLMSLGEEFTKEVQAGDTVEIPPNTPQRISNVGVEDLIFLCYCTPAFGPEAYEDLE